MAANVAVDYTGFDYPVNFAGLHPAAKNRRVECRGMLRAVRDIPQQLTGGRVRGSMCCTGARMTTENNPEQISDSVTDFAEPESLLSWAIAQSSIRISVVVPTYNSVDTLSLCLDALLSQDLDSNKYEIIVVDDGSTDNTEEVVARYLNKSPTISYHKKPNSGPAAARNLGAQRACGAILAFTDADCEPSHDWLTQIAGSFDEGGDDIVAVKGAYRTRQDSVVARFAQIEFENRYRKMRNTECIDFVDTYSGAFRRSVFLAVGGFDTNFPVANNEDVELSYRMASQGHKMVFNPNAIVYHKHPDTVAGYLKQKFGRAYWRMAVYREFPDKIKTDSYTPQSLKLQIVLAFVMVASFVGGLFFKQYRLALYASLGLFALSSVPFLLTVINVSWLNRLREAASRMIREGVLADWMRKTMRFLLTAVTWLFVTIPRKLLRWPFRATVSVFRRVCRSAFFARTVRGLRVAAAALALAAGKVFRLLWKVMLSPLLLLRWTGRSLRQLGRLLSRVAASLGLQRAIRALIRTRPAMVIVSLLMLLARSLTMGMGVLWGLQSQRRRGAKFLQVCSLIASDIVAMICAGSAAYYSRLYILQRLFHSPDCPIDLYLQFAVLALAFTLSVFFIFGLYKQGRAFSEVTEFVALTKAVAGITVLFMVLLYLAKAPHSRLILGLLCFYTWILVGALRSLVRKALAGRSSGAHPGMSPRILIVGTGEVAQLISRKLERATSLGAEVVGFVDRAPETVGQRINGSEVIGTLEDLSDLIESHNVSDVFVSMPLLSQEELIDFVDRNSSKQGVHFHVVSNVFDLISAEVTLAEETGIPITYLRNEHIELLHLLTKRFLDVVVSATVIVLSFPCWLVIMLAIKLESDGHAIFGQERVGKDGKTFKVLKFRTRYSNVPAFEYSPSAPKDSRITNVGRFLRKTSLDEFPQFVNILRGEMSLVGPRPEMPFIVEKYKAWEMQRLKAKPGLTGLWQIMGRKDLPLHESLEYDFYYIKNQSLLLDLVILIKTIPVILSGKGAY